MPPLNLKIILTLLFALPVTSIGTAAAQSTSRGPTGPSLEDIKKAQSMKLPTADSEVIAVVGESKILFGDIKPRIEAKIKEALKMTGQEFPEEELNFARLNLARGLLAQTIQNKMMRECFLLDQVGPQGPDKRREASELMTGRARQMFHESEVPTLFEKHKAKDLVELDNMLRKKGSSVAARERDFMDAMLGHMYMRSAVNRDPNVSLAEIHNHYMTTRENYKNSAKAKWEQLSVLFENHTREEANQLIRDMGREAYFGGNVQAVARARSEEAFASDGGLHDWTSHGALASKILDAQIFSLPINKLSDVIEDETGFHIIRVLDRKEAGITPLADVQEEIRKKLKAKKVTASQRKMMEEMQQRVSVWTIFPDDIPGAKQLRTTRIASQPDTRNR